MTPERMRLIAKWRAHCDTTHGPNDGLCAACADQAITAAVEEEREACVVREHPDGYWLILHNDAGDAAINLHHAERGPIVRQVIEAAAIRARGKA